MSSRKGLSAILIQSSSSLFVHANVSVAAASAFVRPSRQSSSMSVLLPNNTQLHRIRLHALSTSSLPSCHSLLQKRSAHCATCTCHEEDDDVVHHQEHQNQQQQTLKHQQRTPQQSVPSHTSVSPPPPPSLLGACGHAMEVDPPPRLCPVEPKVSFFRRVLPTNLLTPLSTSAQGRRYLLDALQQHTAAAYWQLTEHAVHQMDPAYCGITTLLVVLNSMCIDPHIRWRGGWRYFGNEETLLQQCCLSPARIQRIGMDLEEFAQLAKCQGLRHVETKRPNNDGHTLEEFRADVIRLLTEPNEEEEGESDVISKQEGVSSTSSSLLSPKRDLGIASSVVVVSFARSVLGQTGEGHFSPLAAYHAATDQVLVLDVARFKYAPYWVPVELLYQAMIPIDERTQQSRGWFLLHPPLAISMTSSSSSSYQGRNITNDASRPAHLVPKVALMIRTADGNEAEPFQQQQAQATAEEQQKGMCPVNKMKIQYCQNNHRQLVDGNNGDNKL